MVFWIGLMVVALFGILWAAKGQKKNANAQTIAVVCLVLILASTIGILAENGIFGGTSSEVSRILKNEAKFSEARAAKLGKYISEKFPNAKVVILLDNNIENSGTSMAALNMLKKSLTGVQIVGTETIVIPEMNPENPVPMEELFNAKPFNEVFAKQKDADLIINFAQFPYNPEEVVNFSIWNEEKAPKLALFNGEIFKLKGAIKAGKVVAAIAMTNMQVDSKQKAPSDLEEAFKMRYTLITPANIDEVAASNSGLFEPEQPEQ